MKTVISKFNVLKFKHQAHLFASQFNEFNRRHQQAEQQLEQFSNRHDELQQPSATSLVAGMVVLSLLLLVIFQTRTDGAAVAEMLFGGVINEYPIFTFGLGLAFCLFGFLMAKGLNLRYAYTEDAIGRRRLTGSWWGSLVGTLFYVGIHVYISAMLYDTGGESGHWAAFLPTLIALFDVFLGVLLGNITILVLQLVWLKWVVGRLGRKKARAALRTAEAVDHYQAALQAYNASLSSGEMTYEETGNIRQALDFHQNPTRKLLPPHSQSNEQSPDNPLPSDELVNGQAVTRMQSPKATPIQLVD